MSSEDGLGMNWTRKKAAEARVVASPFNRAVGHVAQGKPVVAQPKVLVPAQSVKRPIAPPAYRPPPRKFAQPKMTGGPVKSAVPPPVYRPQPVPKVLQTKTTGGEHSAPKEPRPVVPPVYRPERRPLSLQRKMAGTKFPQVPGNGVIQRGQSGSTLSKGSGGGGKKPPPSGNNNNDNDDDIPKPGLLNFEQVATLPPRMVPRLLSDFQLPPKNQAKWNFGQDPDGESKYGKAKELIAALDSLRDFTNLKGLVVDPLSAEDVDEIIKNLLATGGVSSDYHRAGAGRRRDLYVAAGAAGYNLYDEDVRKLLDKVIALYHSYFYESIVTQTGILI